jgi:small subunit ribosomal protein S7
MIYKALNLENKHDQSMEQKNIKRFEGVNERFIIKKFINKITLKGKKLKAEYIFYTVLGKVKRRFSLSSSTLIYTIMGKSCPAIEVKSVRVGGLVKQVPGPIKVNRQLILGIRWIIESAKSRSNRTYIKKLCSEFSSILNSEGNTVNKQIRLHKLAESNKGLLHFRWY